MLFDLRGRGRRRTVQVIYLSLAILMGGGLVLFGIGGATPGGLVDAVTGSGGSGSGTDIYEKRIETLTKQTQANPKDAQAFADLAKAHVQQASIKGYDENTGLYTSEGKAELRKADAAWTRYLDLDPKKVDDGTASLMVNAYGAGGLADLQKSVRALETVIAGRGGSAALYSQLAVLAYAAGDSRKSTLAERQALRRTPEQRRKLVKAQIAAQRSQIDQANVQNSQAQQGQGSGLGG
jgi:hypothetical protein